MAEYRKRIADEIIKEKLSYMGAVLVRGAKWCGKTTTCEQLAKSALYMGDPDAAPKNLEMAKVRPSLLLKGAMPRLIDEWQEAPELWDAVRHSVDHGTRGMYLLTGSAVPPEADANDERGVIRHTGTGRIARYTMRPMSLWESGESSGEVSLKDLLAGKDPTGGASRLTLEDVAELVCRGGWPIAVDLPKRVQCGPAQEYVEAIVESDVSRVDDTLRDPERVRRLMKSLGRLQGTQSAASVICADMKANDGASLSDDTVYRYLAALRRIFVIEDMPAWCPSLRCKTPVRTSDTRYFTDPSVATAVLGVGPGDLMGDMPSFGLFFETLAVRDLRVYADALGARVSHYHDKSDLECDAIVHLEDGTSGLVEVKLGGQKLIDAAADTLKALSDKLDTTRTKAPSFRMVLVADGDFAYRRKDGVIVCPIGCLRP